MSATTTITPHLACRNATDAIAFYGRAFGAETLHVVNSPDGKVMHAALNINGATVFLVDEFPEWGGHSPQSLGGSPVTIHLSVPDCDAVYQRAVEAGCEVRMPLEDQFWGDRYGIVGDPFGHKWSIATTVRQMSPEEFQKAAATAFCPNAEAQA